LAFLLPAFGLTQAQDEAARHADRAAAAIRANQAGTAIRELNAWLRLDPKNVNARANLGMVLFTRGDYKSAAQEFQTVLELSPSLPSAKAFLGMCQIRLGAVRRGQDLLESSVTHVPDNTLRNQAGLELIGSYLNAGELHKAVPVIRLLEEHDPSNPEVQYSAYQLYSALAANALEKLSSSGAGSARVHQVLAQSFMAQEKYAQAVEEYSKALERDPSLSGLHLGRGQAILAEGRTGENRQKAADEFTTELNVNPENADAAYQLGQLYYESSHFDEARAWLTQAVKLRSHFPEAHVALGLILMQTGDETAAFNEFQQAVKQAPDDRMAHYHLAQLYQKSGRKEEANREFDYFRKLSDSQSAKKPLVETDRVLGQQ
jgi:Tfp pilus assembly protein PilF